MAPLRRHFEVPEQACGSDLLRRENESCDQGTTEVKVKWCPNCTQSLEGGPGEARVCHRVEESVDLLRRGPALGGSHRKPICG